MLPILLLAAAAQADPALYLSHHWHMHQPIYWPYENVTETDGRGAYSYSIATVHNDRSGPYTSWPMGAVSNGASWGFEHLGAQVSVSGSLMENLNDFESAGWGFSGWKNSWQSAADMTTSLGNPRLDIVAFGYHHPLMALIDGRAIELQVEMHRVMVERNLGTTTSLGMFPPENAFATWMIPHLKAAGIEWIMVDSIHFELAHVDYARSSGSNLVPPNGADIWNDAPTDWVDLQNIWAPSPVAAPWGYQPHIAVYIDPDTGEEHSIVAVPSARYEGNEDARGGYGALVYDSVLSSYLSQNTDAAHPMLVLMAHDGDNYGGGTDSYYNSNYSAMLSWLSGDSRFEATTVQDYLDMFPVDPNDTIHVEPGGWSGADNGDAEFAKWNGDPGEDGYSPDHHSWAVITAATNHVLQADDLAGYTSAEAIIDGNGSATDMAWRWLLVGQTSCYWYWDNSEGGTWDSHPTRAANEAVAWAEQAITDAGGGDITGPGLYLPQREPYNPGGYEWGDSPESQDFTVWTLAYDRAGLGEVSLRYRVDGDDCRDAANEVYDSGGWHEITMSASALDSRTDPAPSVRAERYEADLDVGTGVLVDYYVHATDLLGNTARSPIMHVVVGELGSADSGDDAPWDPLNPTTDDVITIFADGPGHLHWGVNGWQQPDEEYWPTGTFDWGDGQSVESPLLAGSDGDYYVEIGPFDGGQDVSEINFVFHWADDSWSSPDETIVLGSQAYQVIPDDCTPYHRAGGWDGEEDDDWLEDTGDDAGDPIDTGDPGYDDPDDPGRMGVSNCGCAAPGAPAGLLLGLLGLVGVARRSSERRNG